MPRTPADRDGCLCRLLPRSHGLPRFPGGSASASSLSRPPQASRALRPAGLLNRPRRPLSRGSSPVSCPTKPLVSYRSNRQLSGWNPPPLVIRAVGAHFYPHRSPAGRSRPPFFSALHALAVNDRDRRACVPRGLLAALHVERVMNAIERAVPYSSRARSSRTPSSAAAGLWG